MQSKQTVDCKFRHAVSLATAAFMGMGGALAPAAVSADEAEDFYIREVDSMVQGNCVVCHRSGGQADAGGADILFTSSASANHQAFIDYISVPGGAPDRGRADRVLSKITGGSGHGGGVIFSNGSSQYQTFSAYMDLLLAPDEPVAERRVALTGCATHRASWSLVATRGACRPARGTSEQRTLARTDTRCCRRRPRKGWEGVRSRSAQGRCRCVSVHDLWDAAAVPYLPIGRRRCRTSLPSTIGVATAATSLASRALFHVDSSWSQMRAG